MNTLITIIHEPAYIKSQSVLRWGGAFYMIIKICQVRKWPVFSRLLQFMFNQQIYAYSVHYHAHFQPISHI